MNFSWPIKSGSKGVETESVGPAVWPPAALKFMQARFACSLVDNLLIIFYFVDFYRLKERDRSLTYKSKSKTQRNLIFYERQ